MGGLQYGGHRYGVYPGSLQGFLPWVIFDVKFTLFDRICHPKNLISIDQDHCHFTVLFAMPTAVELSQCTGVGGCGCPISSRVSRNITACLQLRKRAPSLALAAEATTKHKIAHSVKYAPFNLMGFVGSIFHPIKSGHKLCCECSLPRGRMHLSEHSLSCWICGILPLRRDVLPSNP